MKVALGELSNIPEDGAIVVDFFGRETFLLKVEGCPQAVMNVCMHLGGPLEFDGERFVCSWHQAEFGLDGRQLKGPAKAGSRLMFLPTRVEDGTLYYVYGPGESSAS